MPQTPLVKPPTPSKKIALARTEAGVVARQFDDFSIPAPAHQHEWSRWIGLMILLAAMVGRCVIGELGYRSFPIPSGGVAGVMLTGQGDIIEDYTELARVGFSAWVLLGCVIVALGDLRARRGDKPWWMIGSGVLVLLMAISAARGNQTRTALLVCADVAGYIAAYWLARRVCVDRRRFVLLVCVLAGIGLLLAAKAAEQAFIDIPEQQLQWQTDPDGMMRQMGFAPDSVHREVLRLRIENRKATGFLPLTNIFAAQLLVLLAACAGVVALKIRTIRREAVKHKPGDISPAKLLLGLSILGGTAVAWALLQTKSRGALTAGGAIFLAAALLIPWRAKVRTHWKRVVWVVVLLGVLAVATVASWGVAKGTLPTKSMAFRWQYWLGSTTLLAEKPLFGVGGGNFPDEYLRVRNAEGEESVKTPHNVIVHALVQFGVLGGGVFLLLLIWSLAGAFGPMDKKRGIVSSGTGVLRFRHGLMVAGAGAIAILVSRGLFSVAGHSVETYQIGAIIPAILFLAGFAILWPGATAASDDQAVGYLRLSLMMGCAALALHSLVTFSVWMPGVGMLLFASSGAATGSRKRMHTAGRWEARRWGLLPLASSAAMLAAVVVLCLIPLWNQRVVIREMVETVRRGEAVDVVQFGKDLCAADPADTKSPCWMAKFSTMLNLPAREYIEVALTRNPHSAEALYWQAQEAMQEMRTGQRKASKAILQVERAVASNPMDLQLRLSYVELLNELDEKYRDVLLREIALLEGVLARRLAFNPESAWRLTPSEQARLDAIKARLAGN